MILKMSSDKSLVITSPGNTYEDENNAEVIRVLLPKAINGTDIKDCTVWLNFVNTDGCGAPIDLTKHLVEHSDTYYMAEIQMTRMLTDTPGDVQFWVEITSASSDMLARTNKVSHLIKPHTDIADVLPEESLPVLYEILQKLDDLYNSGGIDPNELKKQIVSAVESYLIKNPITETDPTVPSWAKNPNKPIYTATEIGTYDKQHIDEEIGNINILISNQNTKAEIMESAIFGLVQQLNEEAHFRGYLSTNSKIIELQATPNDFAYSAESGTKWVYDADNGWVNTEVPVPDQLTPASETTPKMDGNATAGQEGAYARGDHVHPHDSTKVNVEDFDRAILNKQNKTDDSLNTNSKTIVGAINEILNKYNIIPDWAKAQSKPTYSANEVGAYSKKEIDESLSLKADAGSTYTKDEINSIVSEMEDAVDNYKEAIPTVSDWAKQPNKPEYTAGEVGAYDKAYVDSEFRDVDDSISKLNVSYGIVQEAIVGFSKQLMEESHFRGYLSTNAKVQALSATPNDFAYSAESGTKWVYDAKEGWTDTNTPVPDQLTPASDSTPLMNSEASKGQEEAYARGDHIHPHDITKVDKTEFDSKIGDIEDSLAEHDKEILKKTEETILYEDVVNTPEWINQPAVLSGDVASTFDANDFYYITLKDADGTALPSGQFMLKDFYTEAATVYPVVFSLSNLNTGSTTLVENYPVEFTSGGIIPKMRDAGVWDVTVNPSNWKLNGSRGFLRLVCSGQLAQRMSGAYIISLGTPDKNVSHYHSANTTAFQSDSTKQIIDYATISSVQSYKDNKFCDEFIIERLSDTRYITKRNVAMRCASYSGDTYTASSQMVIGYGDMSENTFITGLSIRFAVKNDRGFIRNGSVIRVTEVK